MFPFKVHTIESAPDASRALLAKLQSEVGFIPNLAATMAESPALLEAFTTLRSVNGRSSSLSAVERELVSIAVALEFDCSYCVAAHSTFAVMAGAAESVVHDVREGRSPDDARIAALTRFTHRLVQKNSHVTDEDVRGLLSAGFERRQVLDVFSTMAQVVLASQTFLLAGTPLDSVFQPRAWSSDTTARALGQ